MELVAAPSGVGDAYEQQLPGEVDGEADEGGHLQILGMRQPRDEGEEEQHGQQRADHGEERQERVGDRRGSG